MESDSFGINPSDVRKASGGYEYTGMSKAYEQAGMDPLGWVAPMFSSGGGGGGGMRQPMAPAMPQESQKPSNIFSQDAEFYANDVQDYVAADSMLKSKNGASVFQIGEPLEFSGEYDPVTKKSRKTMYSIVPHGSRTITLPSGKRVNVAVKDLAANRTVNGVRTPVRSVAFKGGDEAAAKFREMVGNAQSISSSLTELEEIFSRNSILTNWGWSQDGAVAKGLESKVTLEFAKFITDAKGVGGNTSEEDRKIIEAMTPHRASTTWTRLGGNEMALIKQMRRIIDEKVRHHANINGVDLAPIGLNRSKATVDQRMEMVSKSIK